MNRLKDLKEIKVPGNMVFCKAIMKKESKIIIPDEAQAKGGWDYLEILVVGENIKDVEPGELILDVQGSVTLYDVNDTKYALAPRHACTIITPPSNFDA